MEGFDGGGSFGHGDTASCHDQNDPAHLPHQSGHDCEHRTEVSIDLEAEPPEESPRLMVAIWLLPNVIYIVAAVMSVAVVEMWPWLLLHHGWVGVVGVACFCLLMAGSHLYAVRVERFFVRLKNKGTRYAIGMMIAFTEIAAAIATLAGTSAEGHVAATWYGGLGASWGMLGGFMTMMSMAALNEAVRNHKALEDD